MPYISHGRTRFDSGVDVSISLKLPMQSAVSEGFCIGNIKEQYYYLWLNMLLISIKLTNFIICSYNNFLLIFYPCKFFHFSLFLFWSPTFLVWWFSSQYYICGEFGKKKVSHLPLAHLIHIFFIALHVSKSCGFLH